MIEVFEAFPYIFFICEFDPSHSHRKNYPTSSPTSRTSERTGLQRWSMRSSTRTLVKAMISKVGRVFLAFSQLPVQAGWEHRINWTRSAERAKLLQTWIDHEHPTQKGASTTNNQNWKTGISLSNPFAKHCEAALRSQFWFNDGVSYLLSIGHL